MRVSARIAVLASVALVAGAVISAPAAAQAGCTPSEATPAADPGVTAVGGAYVLVATSRPASGIPITVSANGDTWCPTGARVLAGPLVWNPGPALWAPKLYRHRSGRFIAVYSGVRKDTVDTRCIGFAVSSSAALTGPYHHLAKLCHAIRRYIDPAIFFSGNRAYLLYKEDPDRKRHPRLRKRIMGRTIAFGSGLTGYRLGSPRELLKPRGWEGASVEAPTMVRHGRYYLFYSGNRYDTRRYGVGVAVARSPLSRFKRLTSKAIVGGDRTPGHLCGIGHQDITHTPAHGWRIYYHWARLINDPRRAGEKRCDTENRRLTYQRLTWPNGKPKLPALPAGSSTATAPSTCVRHPAEASVACVRNNAHVLDVCDRHADGHRVYARVITDASSPTFLSPFYDDNDSKSGCANIPFTSRIASFAVCVQYEGCSAFRSTSGQPPPPAPAPAPPPPAAKDICASHPSDPSVVCTRNAGHTVDVCDRHADGHRAYARVVTQASYPNFQSPFYDNNDSQPGCANINFPSRVLSVAICVQYEGCSALKPT